MPIIHWNKSDISPQELYALRQADYTGLLLDAVSASDIETDPDNETGIIHFDALVATNAKLEQKADLLTRLMKGKSVAVDVEIYQVTEPFKRNGTVNRAIVFELTDGQTISVYLHNPDITDKTLNPDDELVSWKWLLNKRDVTIVVAPEKGRDLAVRDVCMRLMKLAGKNSEAFARANTKRASTLKEIEDLKKAIPQKEAQLKDLLAQIEAKAAQPAAPTQDTFANDWTMVKQGIKADGMLYDVTYSLLRRQFAVTGFNPANAGRLEPVYVTPDDYFQSSLPMAVKVVIVNYRDSQGIKPVLAPEFRQPLPFAPVIGKLLMPSDYPDGYADWQGEVFRAIVWQADVTQGDAQAIYEGQGEAVARLWASGVDVPTAAREILAAATPQQVDQPVTVSESPIAQFIKQAKNHKTQAWLERHKVTDEQAARLLKAFDANDLTLFYMVLRDLDPSIAEWQNTAFADVIKNSFWEANPEQIKKLSSTAFANLIHGQDEVDQAAYWVLRGSTNKDEIKFAQSFGRRSYSHSSYPQSKQKLLAMAQGYSIGAVETAADESSARVQVVIDELVKNGFVEYSDTSWRKGDWRVEQSFNDTDESSILTLQESVRSILHDEERFTIIANTTDDELKAIAQSILTTAVVKQSHSVRELMNTGLTALGYEPVGTDVWRKDDWTMEHLTTQSSGYKAYFALQYDIDGTARDIARYGIDTNPSTVVRAVQNAVAEVNQLMQLYVGQSITDLDAEQLGRYSLFDASSLKMPSAAQLGLNGYRALAVLQETANNPYPHLWSNGHLVDLISRPAVVQKAIEQYLDGTITEQNTRLITLRSVNKLVDDAVAGCTVPVTPAVSYDSGKKTKNQLMTLADASGKLLVTVNRYYFAYFYKVHPGCTFLAEDANKAVLVKQGGTVIGLLMPNRDSSHLPYVKTRLVAGKSSEPETTVEVPATNAINSADGAQRDFLQSIVEGKIDASSGENYNRLRQIIQTISPEHALYGLLMQTVKAVSDGVGRTLNGGNA